MTWISPIEFNMSLSKELCESRPDNILLATAQKIIIYSFIPFICIAFIEAVVKNMILINLANVAISLLNTGYSFNQFLSGGQ